MAAGAPEVKRALFELPANGTADPLGDVNGLFAADDELEPANPNGDPCCVIGIGEYLGDERGENAGPNVVIG